MKQLKNIDYEIIKNLKIKKNTKKKKKYRCVLKIKMKNINNEEDIKK